MKAISITTTHDGDVAIASLAGDIDMINHHEVLHVLLSTALDRGPRMVVDLTGVNYVDSNGVRMLFELATELNQSRVDWAVALDENSPLMRLLKVTAFAEVASIFSTRAEAAGSLGSG